MICRSLARWIGFLALLGGGTMAVAAEHSKPVNPAPSSTIRLDQFGWKHLKEPSAPEEYEWGIDARRVAFDDRGNIYVGFNVLSQDKLLTRGGTNFVFRVLQFHIQSSAKRALFDFPSHNGRRNSIYLSHNGRLLVDADDKLTDVRSGKEVSLMPERLPHYYLQQPVSGKAIVNITHDGEGSQISILDSDSLSVRKRCIAHQYFGYAVSDSTYFTIREIHDSPSVSILRGRFCQRPSIVGTPVERVPIIYAVSDSLYVLMWPEKVAIGNLDHGELVDYKPHKHEEYNIYIGRFSRNQQRVVVLIDENKGGSNFFDISPATVGERIAVYNLESTKIIASISLPFDRSAGQPQFALSHDGKLIAIVYRGVLNIYPLP